MPSLGLLPRLLPTHRIRREGRQVTVTPSAATNTFFSYQFEQYSAYKMGQKQSKLSNEQLQELEKNTRCMSRMNGIGCWTGVEHDY